MSANGGLPAHRYTTQVTQRWPRGSEPASHIKNFTYTSAILTDLIKKSTTWRWGPQEQQAFDEIKDKVANAKCLGVSRAQGEIILVTDTSNVGGGGTLFQLKALEREEFDSAISQ